MNTGTDTANKSQRRTIVLALAGLIAIGSVIAVWQHSRRSNPKQIEDAIPFASSTEVVNPGYVGPQACASCHAERVAEFQKTRHFVACTLASAARAPGLTAGGSVHLMHDPSLRFQLSHSGNDYVAKAIQTRPQGEDTASYRIDLVYGCGGISDEMYFTWQDDQLFNLPIAWLYPYNSWGHAVSNDLLRPAASNCLECHNTWATHIPGTLNSYRREDMILGVTCERCHGAARDHIAYHREHPHDAARAILHPGTLERERLMEVCTQCHANLKQRGPAFAYRPGEKLASFYRISQTLQPEDDQVANQVQYLRQSKCFQQSEMTCVTCHNPHRPQQPAAIQQACLKCHKPESCLEAPRLPQAVRGSCVACHMPPRIWMNVRYETTDDQFLPVLTRHDHRIAIHPEASQEVLLAWRKTQGDAASREEAKRLSSDLTRHWLKEADQRQQCFNLLGTIGALREAIKIDSSGSTRERLQKAIARLAEFERLLMLGNTIDKGRPTEMIEVMSKILAIKPDYAPSRGDLGMSYLHLGNIPEAVNQWTIAAQNDPEDTFSRTHLAALAFGEDRWVEAASMFETAAEIDPYNAEIQQNWGMAMMKQNRWSDAESHFRLALTIDPNHPGSKDSLQEAVQRQREEVESAKRKKDRWWFLFPMLSLLVAAILGVWWWRMGRGRRVSGTGTSHDLG
jgi:tetratricopeptide (TPR) repeat protein